MDEKPIEIPGSRWEWLLADKRRLAAAIAAALAVLGVAAALAVPVLLGEEADGPDVADVVDPIRPGDSTDATGGADAGADAEDGANGAADGTDGAGNSGDGTDATDGSGAVDGSTPGVPDGSKPPVVPGRAPYVAYRLDGAVWVAREDGTRPVKVADSSRGAFLLSPDGGTLALVEDGVLSLVAVSDLKRTVIGDAEPHGLAWQADSSAVLYLRATENGGKTQVWRVRRRTGADPVKLVDAGAPAVAADGTVVALPAEAMAMVTDPAEGSLLVLPGGRSPREVSTRGVPSACAVEAGTIAYAVMGMTFADADGAEEVVDPEIWVMRVDGSSARRLVGKPATTRPFGYGNLWLSPDGSSLLYAEVGDDGYSRAWVVRLSGGTPVSLTSRRDTYPVGWSADGASVFFIEGNGFQGEATALVRARADGMGRTTVVPGAGL